VSTRPIAYWFSEQKLPVILLENIRFDPGEKRGDLKFAKTLAHGHDFFINDAWGTMHRNDASITVLPQCFSPEKRSYGFLVERELAQLTRLNTQIKQPYTLFLGGGKTTDKIRYLPSLIKQGRLNHLVLLPGVAHTFIAANGVPQAKSPVHSDLFPLCLEIQQLCQKHGVNLVLPKDLLVGNGSWQNGQSIKSIHELTGDDISISSGPAAMEEYQQIIARSKTIFFNGIMGDLRIPSSVKMSEKLITSIAMSSAYSVLGGGDTVTLAQQLDLIKFISFASSGGGSTLAYISGTDLPGLVALEKPNI
jgi:phosphoglycerate kinase